MVLNEARLRLKSLLQYRGKDLTKTNHAGTGRVRPRARPRRHDGSWHGYTGRTTTGLDVARFGLLSIATLPFSLWVATFSYGYVKRVEYCRDALTKEDEDVSALHRGRDQTGDRCLGRDAQLSEVRTLLADEPHRIVVVAGANESGKSRFVSELLRTLDGRRGVNFVQLAPLVDSVSTMTHVLVKSFDLRWLQMRYALVDVLPFAGSEILVMKERFSERDLSQALGVATEALKRHAASSRRGAERPILVIDGLGEGSAWMRSKEGEQCLQRLLQWCIFITKERGLAHVILTGNEQLVLSLTDQNRVTRGHVKVVGLGDLDLDNAAKVVRQELPDATEEEIAKITGTFGGFVHDLQTATRDIQHRVSQRHGGAKSDKERAQIIDEVVSATFRSQVERVTSAFAKGKGESDDTPDRHGGGKGSAETEDMDPYLDPLKVVYSEAQASQDDANARDSDDSSDSVASYSQLQLWQTLERLIVSDDMAVPFADLRDNIFGGDKDPLLELMNDDVLGFDVDTSSDGGWSWKVKPATPAIGRAFRHLVSNSDLKKRFEGVERHAECQEKIKQTEQDRLNLWRERKGLELRKASMLSTVELGKELGRNDTARRRLASVFDSIVSEEAEYERRDRQLRDKLQLLTQTISSSSADKFEGTEESSQPSSDHVSIQRQLKSAVLQLIEREQQGGMDKFSRLKAAFPQLDLSSGITAADLARVIENATGEKVDMDVARSFVEVWDANNDNHLDYDEFVQMLLADPKERRS